jgi:hypothetical protein
VTSRGLTVAAYAGLALALLALALVGRRRPRLVAPLGDVARRAGGSRSGQLLLLLSWWWLGWHFLLAS